MSFSCKLMLLVCVIMLHSEAGSTPPVRISDSILIKRNLNNFGNMIECETNDSRWKYSAYGCWCGYGGAGAPLDGIDRCCYEHDKCYDKLIASDNCTTTIDPYVISYKYTNCSECVSASVYGIWDWIGWTTIKCRMGTCACDSAGAKCFARNVYNNTYAFYDKSKCGNDTHA